MTRSSESAELVGIMAADDATRRRLSPIQLRLRWAAALLGLLNLVALYFYLSPPGGSRQDLELESEQVRTQVRAAQIQAAKSHGLAANMQTAGDQATAFSDKYFLPRRTAYVSVFEEIQRMAKASGIQERDAGLTEEPIEGTADLTLLNITANYEGSYANLMKFLYEADHSPMLLVLDMLTAAPQQRNNQINTTIRFQTIVREPSSNGALTPASTTGGQRP
jgi:Tfp pilus assembly protein PilO